MLLSMAEPMQGIGWNLSGTELGQPHPHTLSAVAVSGQNEEPSIPVLESPLEPASRFSSLVRAFKNAYIATSFELDGLMAFPS